MEVDKQGPWKLSTSPAPTTTSMFKAMKTLILTVRNPKFVVNKVASALADNGVNKTTVEDVLTGIIETLAAWEHSMHKKVAANSEVLMKEMNEFELPEYKDGENDEVNDKSILACTCVQAVSKLVQKTKAFIGAVKKCCCDLAGVNVDTKPMEASMLRGRMLAYTFAIVSVLQSSVWKSVSKESVSKKESRQASIVHDLQFALNGATANGVKLPDSLLQRCADRLSQAGLKLPEPA